MKEVISGRINLTQKLDNGQIVSLTAIRFDTLDREYYFISLFINKKCKGYKKLEQTGKCGVVGLLTAKSLLQQLIDQLNASSYKKVTIIIYADDSRRMKIYKRYLQDMGFYKSFWGKKCLRKEVK